VVQIAWNRDCDDARGPAVKASGGQGLNMSESAASFLSSSSESARKDVRMLAETVASLVTHYMRAEMLESESLMTDSLRKDTADTVGLCSKWKSQLTIM
jgi:hypothetical protein